MSVRGVPDNRSVVLKVETLFRCSVAVEEGGGKCFADGVKAHTGHFGGGGPLSTARDRSDQQWFRITHPFHPLMGEEYELVGFTHTWGENRVFFRKSGDQRICSLPAGWTDVEGPDAYEAMAAGRSVFRVDDLLALSALVAEFSQRRL